MKLSERQSSLVILFVYLLGLIAVYFALRPGLGIGFHFDSYPNLNTLSNINDLDSALLFIFSGIAGPTGRPLSLATFVLQADAWPDSPQVMLFVNLFIHFLNGILLFAITWGIARFLAFSQRASLVAAVIASLLWIACPLLLSTTFSVIQRMTSLAATFMLLGGGGHLLIRSRSSLSDSARLGLLTVNLAVFTLLAMLAKENGLLLPVLVLALEATILPPFIIHQDRAWRAWRIACLWVPLIVILVYLASRWDYGEWTIARRGFTGSERLLTQIVILWEYLFHASLPALRNLGFFHDDYQPYRSLWNIRVVGAVVGWLLILAGAVIWRRRVPLFSLAVFWYLGAHLIESSVVPLELYFEHRSYVPLMGLFMAIGLAIVSLPISTARTAGMAAGLYFVMMLVVSFSATSLWSRDLDAAEFWLERKPQSERAVWFYIREQLDTDNPRAAVGLLDQAGRRIPDSELFFDLSRLWLQCRYEELSDIEIDFDGIAERLSEAGFHASIVSLLSDLYEIRDDPECSRIDAERLETAVDQLLRNRNYSIRRGGQFPLNRLKANLLYDSGRERESIDFYERALLGKESVPMLVHLSGLYREFGLYARGCEFLDTLIENAPRRPYIGSRWVSEVRGQRRQLGNHSPQGDCRLVVGQNQDS